MECGMYSYFCIVNIVDIHIIYGKFTALSLYSFKTFFEPNNLDSMQL